jgi:tetratricopeptide (TPR) repeat protein
VGDYEGAHRSYARALELDRRIVDAWVARGAAYANQRHYQRAEADFEAALGADGALAAHQTHRGPCYNDF